MDRQNHEEDHKDTDKDRNGEGDVAVHCPEKLYESNEEEDHRDLKKGRNGRDDSDYVGIVPFFDADLAYEDVLAGSGER